jgi:ABC-type methionine transport system ATPase subunit
MLGGGAETLSSSWIVAVALDRLGESTAMLETAMLLGELDLSDLSGRVVGRLSGGESQRLALAVALAGAPGLLLADEPTSQLDRPNRDRIVAMLRLVASRFGTTLVAVTHDADVARALGRTVSIVAGRADDHSQLREQFVEVDASGTVQLPGDVLDVLPPGATARVVRKADGVELVRHESTATGDDEPEHDGGAPA